MRAHKAEIRLTADQRQQVLKTLGVGCHLYNLYIATNEERYQQGLNFRAAQCFRPMGQPRIRPGESMD